MNPQPTNLPTISPKVSSTKSFSPAGFQTPNSYLSPPAHRQPNPSSNRFSVQKPNSAGTWTRKSDWFYSVLTSRLLNPQPTSPPTSAKVSSTKSFFASWVPNPKLLPIAPQPTDSPTLTPGYCSDDNNVRCVIGGNLSECGCVGGRRNLRALASCATEGSVTTACGAPSGPGITSKTCCSGLTCNGNSCAKEAVPTNPPTSANPTKNPTNKPTDSPTTCAYSQLSFRHGPFKTHPSLSPPPQPIQPHSRRASPLLTPATVNVSRTPSRHNPRNLLRMFPLRQRLVLPRAPLLRHLRTPLLMCAPKRTMIAQKTVNAVMEIAGGSIHATNELEISNNLFVK